MRKASNIGIGLHRVQGDFTANNSVEEVESVYDASTVNRHTISTLIEPGKGVYAWGQNKDGELSLATVDTASNHDSS